MNNHRCISQKSLITVRKWLLEAGDGPSTSSFCISPSRCNHHIQPETHRNKIVKRKRLDHHTKTRSLIDWFYELIEKIFTVYDEHAQHRVVDDPVVSCSTCRFENSTRSILTASKSNPKLMITTATSSSNLNIPLQLTVRPSSKSIQTQTNNTEQPSTTYPLYCFSVKDGEILPLMLSSPSPSSRVIPVVKELISSSSPITSPLKTDVQSLTHSDSNISSLPIGQNLMDGDMIISKVHRPSSSLHTTRICHFDKHNCLIECYRSSSTNLPTPDVVFAKSTCQLIKQAWISSTTDQ